MGRAAQAIGLLGLLGACGLTGAGQAPEGEVSGESRVGGITTDVTVRPRARPVDLVNRVADAFAPEGARTAEAFDTISAEERAAATAGNAQGPELGSTVASLGYPAETGLWIKTPLVTREGPGRVRYPANGKSVAVTLIPLDGPKTAGSRLSLSAMQALGAPLTDLPTVEVFSES